MSDKIQPEEAHRDTTAPDNPRGSVAAILSDQPGNLAESICTNEKFVSKEDDVNQFEEEEEEKEGEEKDEGKEEEEEEEEEDYPGDGLPHPALESDLTVFIDPNYNDVTKNEIWNTQNDRYFNYKFALNFWTRLSESIDSGSPPSKAEANSQSLRKEWWANTGFDSEMTGSIRAWIEEAADWALHLEVQPRVPDGTYNHALLALWREEYRVSLMSGRPEVALELINPFRQRAASVAASHRLMDAALRSISSRGLLEYPPRHEQEAGTVRTTLNANIDSCYWLAEPGRHAEPPFYLWDKVARRSVRTCDLASRPSYIAVSHTWGRWRTDSAHIDGVLWPVPGCEKFDVERLPDLLAAIPFSQNYVWVDLFCIPQLGDPVRARLEIANQAAIFQSAEVAIAWLPSVLSWDGLENAINLIALQCFSVESEFDVDVAMGHCTAEAEKVPTYLAEIGSQDRGDDFAFNRLGQIQPWFTSLWTLQELCLRPDMLLCDKRWQPLTISDFQVPLDHIAALYMSKLWDLYHASKPGSPLALAVTELSLPFMDIRIAELPELTPMTALILGDRRYCASRRAEAIMSVVGCTDWFLDDISDEPGNRELVLGRYPLAFVEEVRRKTGAAFFATVDHSPIAFTEKGSLLPFSAERQDGAMNVRGLLPYNHMATVEDHPSVATWVIEVSGVVFLPKVGLVASYPRRANDKEIRVNISGGMAQEGCPATPKSKVELHAFLESFLPYQKKYAVHLLRSSCTLYYGAIFIDAPQVSQEHVKKHDGATPLLKLVNFFYQSVAKDTYSRTEEVKWIVL